MSLRNEIKTQFVKSSHLKWWKKWIKSFSRTYKKEGFAAMMSTISMMVSRKVRWIKQQGKSYNNYASWLEQYDNLTEKKLNEKKLLISCFKYRPLISIIMPVYNVPKEYLVKAIESVKNQSYQNWELCIADDGSKFSYIKEIIKLYADNDPRIKFIMRSQNGHISACSNTALTLATGEYIGLLDHDDELHPLALFYVVKMLNQNPAIDLLYSDEDRINLSGQRSNPMFKPDWSPDLLMSTNYICHFLVIRHELLKKIGGFREGYEGAQDYDMVLRATLHTNLICHIPRVLYSWRQLPSSTSFDMDSKPYAHLAGLKALQDNLDNKFGAGYAVAIEQGDYPCVYNIEYRLNTKPLVSIIIPSKDNYQLLKQCIESIINLSTYPHYEILVMSNNTENEHALAYMDELRSKPHVRVIEANYPFNWSKVNNHGIREAKGEVFVFLNDDTKLLTPNWLEIIVGHASQSSTGTIGAQLLYENNSLQHAGMVVGMNAWADHLYRGLKPYEAEFKGFINPLIKRNVLASTGACLAASKRLIDQIGGFDEDFIVVGSDVELSIRAYEAGFYNIYDPEIVLYHYECQTRDPMDMESVDYALSAKLYKPYLDMGDPFYSPHL